MFDDIINIVCLIYIYIYIHKRAKFSNLSAVHIVKWVYHSLRGNCITSFNYLRADVCGTIMRIHDWTYWTKPIQEVPCYTQLNFTKREFIPFAIFSILVQFYLFFFILDTKLVLFQFFSDELNRIKRYLHQKKKNHSF